MDWLNNMFVVEMVALAGSFLSFFLFLLINRRRDSKQRFGRMLTGAFLAFASPGGLIAIHAAPTSWQPFWLVLVGLTWIVGLVVMNTAIVRRGYAMVDRKPGNPGKSV